MSDATVTKQTPIQIQRKPASSNSKRELSSETESKINSLQNSGQTLSKQTRSFFEPRFGQNFSNVRVHTDSNANDLASSINAKAFTKGNNIVFNTGEYTPNSSNGKRLLGHELTHVVQQRSNKTLISRDKNNYHNDTLNNLFNDTNSRNQSTEISEIKENNTSIDGGSYFQKASNLYTIYDAAYNDLTTHAAKWKTASKTYGLCYYNAYDNYKKILSKQDTQDALTKEVLFSVLSIVTVGSLSGISTALTAGSKLSTIAEISVNSIEDIAQAGADKALSFAGKTSPSKAISKNPLKFYLELEKGLSSHIDKQYAILNQYVQDFKDMTLKPDPKIYPRLESIDPIKTNKQVAQWKKGIDLFQDPPKFDEKALTKALEIAIWAQWAALTRVYNVKKPLCTTRGCQEITKKVINDPGSIIEKHLDKLGISKDANVNWGQWTFDSDVKKLAQWGKTWKPKKVFKV